LGSQFRRSHLRVEKIDNVTLVKFTTADLGEVHMQAAADELNALVDRLVRPRLRLDFGAVRFLTSTALGKLVALHTRVRAAGGRLVLVNLTDLVYEVFEVSRLTQVLDVRRAARGDHSSSAPALAS
jgi:anti-anti-sigma factor